jgi:hypothetical protein
MVEYTPVPDEFTGDNYDKWFSLETIREKYNGDILKACESHPAYFSYFLIGTKPRDYQLYHLDEMLNNKYIHTLMGRRMGKSTDFKLFAAWAMWYNKFPQGRDKTTKVIVLAQESEEAESYIREIRDMYEVGDRRVESLFKGKLGKRYFSSSFPKRSDNAKMNESQLSIYKDGWNTIRAFPPTMKARGKSASIIIMDELAFWYKYTPDEYEIYKEVVRPVITDQPNVKSFIATTPNGSTGLSYDLMNIEKHKTIYKQIWFPYFYRKDESYLEEIKKVKEEYEAQGWHNSFRQEYLAELVNRQDAYFDKINEIDKVFANNDMTMVTSYPMECEAAIDFGGSVKSRTVITVSRFNHDNGKLERLYCRRYPVGQDSTLKEDIIDIAKAFPLIQKWHVDSQGGGSAFYAWFKIKFGGYRIDEVTFRGQKADMYRLFKMACFKDRVKSFYDPELMEEFMNFTPDLRPSKNSTDDMLDSFLMSIKDWLEEKEKSTFRVINY